jgi:hypothetical protein
MGPHRHPGRDSRGPDARDGKDASHPCVLNSGNPCRNGGSIKRHCTSPALQALTAAALVLPGLMLSAPGIAQDDEAEFQYSHYKEGRRKFFSDVPNRADPIEVDTLQGGAQLTLTDRIKFAFKYVQDTWGGATPVATAPLVFKTNNAVTVNNIVTGASPLVRPSGDHILVDKDFNPVEEIGSADADGVRAFKKNTQLVHTLSTASPETRKQGDFKLSYELDNATLDVGGGISIERDYESRYGNLGARLDFNQKRTSLNLGLSYTNSDIDALLDHDMNPYVVKDAFLASGELKNVPLSNGTVTNRLQSTREDWATNLGLTQILTKDALLRIGAGYTRSTGYMANPYKVVEVLFVDPGQTPDVINPFGDGRDFFSDGRPADILQAVVHPFLEKRPDVRNQWNLSTRYVQYIDPLDAALHLDYRFSTDDWGIHAHTFAADWVQPLGWGWTLTPRVRYYTQDAADFYRPFLVVNQKFDGSGTDFRKLPDSYSSDHRLSGYGALSGALSISKRLTRGIVLEGGFEYYKHAGSLKLGSGGEENFADFKYWVANAALKVNLSALAEAGSGAEHAHHHAHHDHGPPIPAGVMFAHMLDKAGSVMVGYRYMYGRQAGDMLRGRSRVSDRTVVDRACGGPALIDKCFLAGSEMEMNMHMLDLMYAPTDWLNLMLMPQFVDMDMSMRSLDGAPSKNLTGAPDKLRHIDHHLSAGHSTGGVGDTGMYALFKLLGTPHHHVNLTLGVTAPTGDVDIKLRRNHRVDGGFINFGMQLGSGTWDFKPALTYTGQYGPWSWGAQVNGTKRLENENESGFAFGDILQSTAWGSYKLFDWLSASMRGVYTSQGAIKGDFNGLIQRLAPADYPKNYGGKFWDLGLGLNAAVTNGPLMGNTLSFEWLQPVSTDYNGYQLDRDGALAATWSYMF